MSSHLEELEIIKGDRKTVVLSLSEESTRQSVTPITQPYKTRTIGFGEKNQIYSGIEAGGTKFVCVISGGGEILEETSTPTMTPEEILDQIFEFSNRYELNGIGISSFGPIGVGQTRDNYGYVLTTPKGKWAQFDFLGAIRKRYNIPVAWTADINVAAYRELKQETTRGKNNCICLIVGIGVGTGAAINEEIFSGIAHSKVGHIWVKHHPDDQCGGACPYHRDCLEGLAAGPSIETRIGIRGQDPPRDHPIWDIQAFYIAQALISYTLTLAPEKIILDGGVMSQSHLPQKIHQQFAKLMGGYMEMPQVSEYIVRWGLPNESGTIGSLLLAERERQK